jgi:hypothetical protein
MASGDAAFALMQQRSVEPEPRPVHGPPADRRDVGKSREEPRGGQPPRKELAGDGLSFLFRWRITVASSMGPTDYALTLESGRQKVVSGLLQRSVAHALATHMDHHGRCYPAMETIAVETACSERGVRYAVRALEETSWLDVEIGGSLRGMRRSSSSYRAAFPPQSQWLLPAAGLGHADPQFGSAPGHTGTSSAARRAPERDRNAKHSLADERSKSAQLERWLEVQGREYAVDCHAFEGELRERFGIEPGTETAKQLRRRALETSPEVSEP